MASIGFLVAGYEFGWALRYDAAATFTAFGAEVDDPVGLLDDVQMMLDDEDGVTELDEALENVEKFANVVEM